MKVIIVNKLGQSLDVSVRNPDTGNAVSLKLGPRGRSEPIEKRNVTEYTNNLAAKGRVRIRPA